MVQRKHMISAESSYNMQMKSISDVLRNIPCINLAKGDLCLDFLIFCLKCYSNLK